MIIMSDKEFKNILDKEVEITLNKVLMKTLGQPVHFVGEFGEGFDAGLKHVQRIIDSMIEQVSTRKLK